MHVDAHFHAWQIARGDYGWLTPERVPLYRDVSVADWQAQAAPCGIAGGVLVQAAPTEGETHFLLQLAEQKEPRENLVDASSTLSAPEVLGVVGWVDWLAPDAAERVHALARHPKLKGLRPMLQDLADPAWVLQPALRPALEAMAACGLVFDALVRSAHLPHILTLAQRHPNLSIVIDHSAKPNIVAAEWQPWAACLGRIARETTASCKLSGLFTEAGSTAQGADLQRWADHILACFGPKRVMWGSDWPVLERSGKSYADWWQATQQLLTRFSATERGAILGCNAARLYQL
jgi:L-fuconolactonase